MWAVLNKKKQLTRLGEVYRSVHQKFSCHTPQHITRHRWLADDSNICRATYDWVQPSHGSPLASPSAQWPNNIWLSGHRNVQQKQYIHTQVITTANQYNDELKKKIKACLTLQQLPAWMPPEKSIKQKVNPNSFQQQKRWADFKPRNKWILTNSPNRMKLIGDFLRTSGKQARAMITTISNTLKK